VGGGGSNAALQSKKKLDLTEPEIQGDLRAMQSESGFWPSWSCPAGSAICRLEKKCDMQTDQTFPADQISDSPVRHSESLEKAGSLRHELTHQAPAIYSGEGVGWGGWGSLAPCLHDALHRLQLLEGRRLSLVLRRRGGCQHVDSL